jgi:hypothetical protein
MFEINGWAIDEQLENMRRENVYKTYIYIYYRKGLKNKTYGGGGGDDILRRDKLPVLLDTRGRFAFALLRN